MNSWESDRIFYVRVRFRSIIRWWSIGVWSRRIRFWKYNTYREWGVISIIAEFGEGNGVVIGRINKVRLKLIRRSHK